MFLRSLFFFVMLSVASTVFAAGDAELRVASFNLRQKNTRDSVKGNGWDNRYPVIADMIRFHEFEIFGTQEGFKHQLEDLKGKLPGYEYIGVGRDDGKEKGEYSAIFYDANLFELLDKGNFWLSETPDKPGLGWDAACVRVCSWGKFRDKASGKVFQFFNLHLDHVGVKARIESVRLVQKKMKEFGLDLPTFLTGDFNVDQFNDMYKELAGSDILDDSFVTAKFVYAPNGTFNSYHTDSFTDSRIDHIFVSKGMDVEKYGVLTDTYRWPIVRESEAVAKDSPREIKLYNATPRTPSDHFPIMIKARF